MPVSHSSEVMVLGMAMPRSWYTCAGLLFSACVYVECVGVPVDVRGQLSGFPSTMWPGLRDQTQTFRTGGKRL